MRHGFSLFHVVLTCALFAFAPNLAHASKDPRKDSGLPVPRFVSLKSSEINVRSGPGTRYPILWVYRKDGLPVEIVEEFDTWRKIRDAEGTQGWVNKQMLSGERRVIIKGKDPLTLRADPEGDARASMKAEAGVIARLLECEAEWCRVQVESRKAWAPKAALWGVYKDEVVEK